MSNIKKAEERWNKKVRECIKKAGFGNQREFANAYKQRFGACTQTNVSRWINVGGKCSRGKDSNEKSSIGFPSYETMMKIAEFFGVSVGYLTGETDYKTFDMERACRCIGIDKASGEALESIVSAKEKRSFEGLFAEDYAVALRLILTAPSFRGFLSLLCTLAAEMYEDKNPSYYLQQASNEIDAQILEEAVEKMGDLDIDETNTSPEVLDAITELEEAIDKDMQTSHQRGKMIKVLRYELFVQYTKLIDEMVQDAHLAEMTENHRIRVANTAELKQLIEKRG